MMCEAQQKQGEHVIAVPHQKNIASFHLLPEPGTRREEDEQDRSCYLSQRAIYPRPEPCVTAEPYGAVAEETPSRFIARRTPYILITVTRLEYHARGAT